MNVSRPFIERPVATTLLTLAIALAGMLAFRLLPVAPLPQVEFPTIVVSAALPGASPETMAATVATPLERALARIAGVSEMTSTSTLGNTRIILQFELDRAIEGAARDVQGAINAARALLPSGLPGNPTYRKANPADSPIMIVALTSPTYTRGQMYDAATTVLAQKIAQVSGVGQVTVGGGALPAVRVELNLPALNAAGISLESVRATIAATNANRPKGYVETATQRWQIAANDQATRAADYAPVVIAYRNGAALRLSDVAEVSDSVQDIRSDGSTNGKPSIQMLVYRQPGANIIETVEQVKAILPQLAASIPAGMDVRVVMERTTTIRASLHEVERALLLSVALVIMVVFVFLRRARATLIPAIAVPVSLLGTFGVMYLCGYSIDNLSLMALTVSTGFVVDDAIVVLENVTRHIEAGKRPFAAALEGAREVGFTVLSMSLSLIAVFVPVLLMGGIIGRLFREFAVTLSVAIIVSLVVSLTTTPMLCARWLRPTNESRGRLERAFEHGFARLCAGYDHTLGTALRHPLLMLTLLFAIVALNFWLYVVVPKGFFPQQDNGLMLGSIQADQGISFQAMRAKVDQLAAIVGADPAVQTVTAYTGGSQRNGGFMFVVLKPQKERGITSDALAGRLRAKTSHLPGVALYLVAAQDLRVGGRSSGAQFQFTLQSDDLAELRAWEPRVRQMMSTLPQLADVNTDEQDRGQQITLEVDRDAAARLGVPYALIDATLNDAFGQRQVSTIYAALNQYHVVMEAAPVWWQHPESLQHIQFQTSSGAKVPLSAIARYRYTNTALAVNHQGLAASSTVSFNLAEGVSLSQASQAIQNGLQQLGPPVTLRGAFQGSAKAFKDSLSNQPWLILAALVTIYIVLGVLYESYIHPLTILSTLPSAGAGAILALMLVGKDFDIMALIGVILLIGIVKKNAIMMIDLAIAIERREGVTPRDSIRRAAVQRLRPILMTTLAAMLGALPLALGSGEGSELRHPLGISVVGGLIVSQLLTLYTTPVVYLYLDRLSLWVRRRRRHGAAQGALHAS
ncbi:MAG: multidrug efflux RND transporter permease subunit [Rhodocyclaceae bacterium]|nr:multidrug efflux RND transporter permease subunit [Rhodocyclaceae bacterium]